MIITPAAIELLTDEVMPQLPTLTLRELILVVYDGVNKTWSLRRGPAKAATATVTATETAVQLGCARTMTREQAHASVERAVTAVVRARSRRT